MPSGKNEKQCSRGKMLKNIYTSASIGVQCLLHWAWSTECPCKLLCIGDLIPCRSTYFSSRTNAIGLSLNFVGLTEHKDGKSRIQFLPSSNMVTQVQSSMYKKYIGKCYIHYSHGKTKLKQSWPMSELYLNSSLCLLLLVSSYYAFF